MDIGTINRSDSTAGKVRPFLNTRRARSFLATLSQREDEIRDEDARLSHQHAEKTSFPLHMGHEPLPVKPCRSRVIGIGLHHHHKLFGSQSMVLRTGSTKGWAVCGSWSLAVGWKIDAESIVGRASTSASASLQDPTFIGTRIKPPGEQIVIWVASLFDGTDTRRIGLRCSSRSTRESRAVSRVCLFLSITDVLRTTASDGDAVGWIGVKTLLRFQPSCPAALHSKLSFLIRFDSVSDVFLA
ncbi:hypothetical protein BC827DRAFT_256362 [Russula dissimulans]|nr:hypothetical protein BC827DRAFT_256362 [Russula dissimulans]